jgi:hypothetical protein
MMSAMVTSGNSPALIRTGAANNKINSRRHRMARFYRELKSGRELKK